MDLARAMQPLAYLLAPVVLYQGTESATLGAISQRAALGHRSPTVTAAVYLAGCC